MILKKLNNKQIAVWNFSRRGTKAQKLLIHWLCAFAPLREAFFQTFCTRGFLQKPDWWLSPRSVRINANLYFGFICDDLSQTLIHFLALIHLLAKVATELSVMSTRKKPDLVVTKSGYLIANPVGG